MKKSATAKSFNIREFDVYFRSKGNKELIWCNSFTSLSKDNKRAAKYWVNKMKQKTTDYEYVIIERD